MEIKNVRITIEFERHREGEEVYYETLKLDPAELKEVEEFVYLGSKLTTDGDCEKEINSRITKQTRLSECLNLFGSRQT